MMRRAVSAVAFGLVFAACSGRNPDSGNGATPRSNNVITRQELASANVTNAYDAVQRLRPAFLRARTVAGSISGSQGSTTQGYAVLYVDGIRRGSPEGLRNIPTEEVAEVRFLSAADATTRYGMNVAAGVIDVKLIGR